MNQRQNRNEMRVNTKTNSIEIANTATEREGMNMTDTNIKKMKGFLFMIMAMACIALFGKSAMAGELNSSTYSYSDNDWDDWDDYDDEDDWDNYDDDYIEEEEEEEEEDFTYYDEETGLTYWYPGDYSKEVEVEGRISNNRRAVIKIPRKIVIDDETYTVTSISDHAFSDDKRLKRVTISENIVSIGDYAFSNCKNLK